MGVWPFSERYLLRGAQVCSSPGTHRAVIAPVFACVLTALPSDPSLPDTCRGRKSSRRKKESKNLILGADLAGCIRNILRTLERTRQGMTLRE